MDWYTHNIKVYDDSANELAEYFSGIGSRTEDIKRGLVLADKDTDARVVEIGCGDGRDGDEIVQRVKWYEGFDPSVGLLKLAIAKVPGASFVVADALSYEYPNNLDVVYAFASLLHVNQSDLSDVFKKVNESLRFGGVFYISLKERTQYTEEVKTDQYGERMFYYYNPSILKQLAGESFAVVHESHQKIGHTDWFTIAFKKSKI